MRPPREGVAFGVLSYAMHRCFGLMMVALLIASCKRAGCQSDRAPPSPPLKEAAVTSPPKQMPPLAKTSLRKTRDAIVAAFESDGQKNVLFEIKSPIDREHWVIEVRDATQKEWLVFKKTAGGAEFSHGIITLDAESQAKAKVIELGDEGAPLALLVQKSAALEAAGRDVNLSALFWVKSGDTIIDFATETGDDCNFDQRITALDEKMNGFSILRVNEEHEDCHGDEEDRFSEFAFCDSKYRAIASCLERDVDNKDARCTTRDCMMAEVRLALRREGLSPEVAFNTDIRSADFLVAVDVSDTDIQLLSFSRAEEELRFDSVAGYKKSASILKVLLGPKKHQVGIEITDTPAPPEGLDYGEPRTQRELRRETGAMIVGLESTASKNGGGYFVGIPPFTHVRTRLPFVQKG